MKKLIGLLFLISGLAMVSAASPSPAVKGVIILTSASGLHARNVLFSDLVWTDFYGGMVTGNDGQKTPFANKDIAKIVYFDSQYYTQLDNREDLQAFRGGLQVREVVANTNISELVTDDDFKSAQESESTLEYIGQRYPTVQALLQPQINFLKNDISLYSQGKRFVDGEWVAKAQVEAELHAKKPAPEEQGASITTRDGRTYTDVGSIQAEDDGVTITYSGGVARILSQDLPLELQKQFGQDPATLAAKQKAAAAAQAATLAKEKSQEEQQKETAEATAAAKAQAENSALMEKQREDADAAAQARAMAYAKALRQLPKSFDAVPGSSSPGTAPGGTSVVEPGTSAGATAGTTSGSETANFAIDTVTYPGAAYSYNTFKDICYLDSPPADAMPFPAPDVSDPMAGRTSLTLRTETDGNQPEHPDKIVGTIMNIIAAGKLSDSYTVTFSVDGTTVTVNDAQRKVSDALSSFGQVAEYLSFSLTPEQARTITSGKNVKFSIGNDNYKLEQAETDKLQRYFTVLDKLPPHSSYLVRKFRNFVSGLPPASTLLSEICVDIILAAFFFVGTLGIVLFVVGATRFMKM